MTTSGTYSWSPEIIEFCDESFERVGIDPAELGARHLRAARRSLEFMLSEWANQGILLWAVDQVTVTLTQSTATYATPVGTTAILDMVLRRDDLDTGIFPMSRDEYLMIPSKTQEGIPSRYYFDRTHTVASVPAVSGAVGPTITLWSTPILSTDQILYHRLRRLQDAGVATNTPDIPYRWQEAFAAGLAARLAGKFAPDREDKLRGQASGQLKLALQEDRERVPTTTRVRFSSRGGYR